MKSKITNDALDAVIKATAGINVGADHDPAFDLRQLALSCAAERKWNETPSTAIGVAEAVAVRALALEVITARVRIAKLVAKMKRYVELNKQQRIEPYTFAIWIEELTGEGGGT